MTASLRAALGPALAHGLTSAAPRPVTQVSAVPIQLSFLTYNVAFLPVLPSPLPMMYAGTEPEACRDAVCAAIRASNTDLVGLCETWAFTEDLAASLADVYPYRGAEPSIGLSVKLIGSGLLLLSRHPILASGAYAYRRADGDDTIANKGATFLRVSIQGLPGPLDVFYTHMQAVYSDGRGATAHAAQLAELAAWMKEVRDPDHPAILAGDLNFDGMRATEYAAALTALGDPVDAWVCQPTPHAAGPTFSYVNDFLRDRTAAGDPTYDQRLDYVLTYPGRRWTPSFDPVEVLRWRANNAVSDHFGLGVSSHHAMVFS